MKRLNWLKLVYSCQATRVTSTLDEIRDMRVAKSTKAGYKSGLNQIKKWIVNHGSPDLLTIEGQINLSTFGYSHFLAFIQWTYQNTSNKPGTIASYRSAIRDLYKRTNTEIPAQYDSDMKDIYQGTVSKLMLIDKCF